MAQVLSHSIFGNLKPRITPGFCVRNKFCLLFKNKPASLGDTLQSLLQGSLFSPSVDLSCLTRNKAEDD